MSGSPHYDQNVSPMVAATPRTKYEVLRDLCPEVVEFLEAMAATHGQASANAGREAREFLLKLRR